MTIPPIPPSPRGAPPRPHPHGWELARLPSSVAAKLAQFRETPPSQVWRNATYQVLVFFNHVKVAGWPPMHWLSIKRLDKQAIHDWRELQQIKNDLIGPEHEAVELYPAESRLLDTSNQFHLWVVANAKRQFPFGFTTRAVCEAHDGGEGGSKQRAWPEGQQPKDALTTAEYNALCDDAVGPGVQVGAGVPSMPAYRTRATPCDVCGGTMDPHLCGVGMVNGVMRRYPIYTGGRGEAVDAGGPHPIDEGDAQ